MAICYEVLKRAPLINKRSVAVVIFRLFCSLHHFITISMARTRKVRPSQGISNVLSQRRQEYHDDEEDERDSLIEPVDEPPRRRRSDDHVFKAPLPPLANCNTPNRTSHRVSASTLDLSVKKWPQEKLASEREVLSVPKSRLEELCIYFVTEVDGTMSHYMTLSYTAAITTKTAISKRSTSEIMKKLDEGRNVFGAYVLEFFEGELYEKLLEYSRKEKRCRIFGPDVLIFARDIDHIPKIGRPLISLSMFRWNVCCSSYTKQEKEEFEKKVVMMGGNFFLKFAKHTSILIAKDIVSEKSQIARKKNIPIVSRGWLDKCWSNCHRQDPVKANDLVKNFKLPIFAGVTISITQISTENRVRLQKAAKRYGFVYQPDVSENVTHLICNREEGTKFDFCRERNIYTVQYSWVEESVKAGYALPEVDFMVGGPLDKDDDDPLRLRPKKRPTTTIECVSDQSQESTDRKDKKPATSGERCNQIPNESNSVDGSQDFVNCLRKCLGNESKNLFDNIEINLYGFKNEILSLCKRLIAQESGFFSVKVQESTSLVIASSDEKKESLKNYLTQNKVSCPVVGERWLTDSLENGRLEPYTPYYLIESQSTPNEMEQRVEDQETSQPSLGFVVAKKDRSMIGSLKRAQEMEIDHVEHFEATGSTSSKNFYEVLQESTKSRGGRTSNSRVTDDEEMDQGESSSQGEEENAEEDENENDDEYDDIDEEEDDEDMEGKDKSAGVVYGARVRQHPVNWSCPLASQIPPQISIPTIDGRVFAKDLNTLSENVYKGEDKRSCLERRKRAEIPIAKRGKGMKRYPHRPGL